MDADLFSPADTAALLAVRAVIAGRRAGLDELQKLFRSAGLTHQANVRDASAGVEGRPGQAPFVDRPDPDSRPLASVRGHCS